MRTETLTVPVGDIDLACTVVGEGTPLVVVHGAIGLGSTYLRALDTWANDVRLVHYDQRGSGRTPLGDVSKATMTGGVDDLEGGSCGASASTASSCSDTRPAPTSPRCTPRHIR